MHDTFLAVPGKLNDLHRLAQLLFLPRRPAAFLADIPGSDNHLHAIPNIFFNLFTLELAESLHANQSPEPFNDP